MEHLVVVPHPIPITLEARSLRHNMVPEGAVGLGYYYDGRLIARSVVAAGAIDTIHSLLAEPVSVALAAREDDKGNIDGRICLVLPVDDDDADDEPAEPWKSSVPSPPGEVDGSLEPQASADGEPRFALLPIGNVVRQAADRHFPGEVADDAREMLENLLQGGGRDAVRKAIDDLLKSI
jgi:hypothetical protein